MRRFLRPIVIAVATLGLALGAGVGLAAPAWADTDPAFTAIVDPAAMPLTSDLGSTQFGGAKSVGPTITSETTNAGAPIDNCTGLDATSANWSCHLDPSDGLSPGTYSIVIEETNTDGTTVQNVLAFVVNGATATAAPTTPTTPVTSVQFVPGGATLTTTVANDGTEVDFDNIAGTQIFLNPTDETAQTGCPASANDDNPEGQNADFAGQQTCHLAYAGGTLVATQSQQAYASDGVDQESDANYVFFYVPSTSNIQVSSAAVNTAAQTVNIVGTADTAAFTQSRVDILNEHGAIICRVNNEVSAGRTYNWSCLTGALGYGSHTLRAVVEDLGSASDGFEGFPSGTYLHGGLSDSVAIGSVNFPLPTTPGAGGTTPGDTTPTWSFTIGGDLTNIHPGDTLTISGSGLPPGTSLDTILHSLPTDLGTVVAAADGTFSQTATVPSDVELGAHTVMVTASGPGIVTTTKQQAITVTATPAASSSSGSSSKTNVDTTKPTATHGNGSNGAGSGIAPNILTKALTPFADVAVHPNKIISAFEIGLVLLLLAVLPAHLLNATIAEQSERFERRFGKVKAPSWLLRVVAWFRSTPVVGGVVVTVAAAILFGFADPKFGFTLASLRLVLACVIALFLVGYVANALTGLIARVQWNVVAAVSTRPYGLILTVIGVVVSRLLHFSPGFLIGLILGLTIQERSAATYAWRTIVLRTSIVLTMAVAAWIGYSTLTLGGNEGGTFGSALLVETLVAITTEGVVALLVELLPLRFLEGQRVYDHSRVLWGIFYFLTLVVFVLAVIPWEGNWDALHGSLWIWIVVLAVFAALCVGVYIYFRRFSPPVEAEDEDEEVPLGEAVSRDQH